MKNPLDKLALSLLAILPISGCFMGGDGDGESSFPKITPGVYIADYSSIPNPPGSQGLETELTLAEDGGFRMFWFADTSVIHDQQGKWGQKNVGLVFTETREIWLDRADSLTAVEDDTNEVRNVTATSFSRREWTPLRQKPFWITYNKSTLPDLKEGEYELVEPASDSSGVPLKTRMAFLGSDFTLTITDTTTEAEIQAKWTQVGTAVLEFTQIRRRDWVDSSHSFTDWDSSAGGFLQHFKVNGDKVGIWSEGLFGGGSWAEYTKIK